MRADMYKGLTEAILKGETDPTTAGKRIVLPSTFVGGARYMIQNYQDAMAICSWAGYPDLFITFTCNHKWPELVDFLKIYNLKPEDRPDLVSRLFKIKLNHLIKDIKKGEIFGKVKAGMYKILILHLIYIAPLSYIHVINIFFLCVQLYIRLNFKSVDFHMLTSWFSCNRVIGLFTLMILIE
jgi:hypothetical protein